MAWMRRLEGYPVRQLGTAHSQLHKQSPTPSLGLFWLSPSFSHPSNPSYFFSLDLQPPSPFFNSFVAYLLCFTSICLFSRAVVHEQYRDICANSCSVYPFC